MPTALLLMCGLMAVAAGGATAGGHGATIEATVVGNPLTVAVVLSKTTARTGQQVGVAAAVRNEGAQPVTAVELTLRVPPDMVVTGGNPRLRASLNAEAAWIASWQICARRPGNYVVLAAVSARDPSGQMFRSDSGSAVFTALGREARC